MIWFDDPDLWRDGAWEAVAPVLARTPDGVAFGVVEIRREAAFDPATLLRGLERQARVNRWLRRAAAAERRAQCARTNGESGVRT